MLAKVSILIPTYNRAHYLRDAIQSALSQTYSSIEILVLDDASPDDTLSVVQEFKNDSRLRYIRHTQNKGIVGNWKSGLSLARGEYFCFLHDDDTFEPEFVERLLEPLRQNPNLILAFCDHWVMDVNGNRSTKDSDESSRYFQRHALGVGHLEDFARSALIYSSLPVGATLFRHNLVSQSFLDECACGSIDTYLFLQCVLSGYGAFYVPKRLMNYRAHEGGMSRSMPLYMAAGHIFRYKIILAEPKLQALHIETRKSLKTTLAHMAITLATAGQAAAARGRAWESWRLKPNGKALFAFALGCTGCLATRIFSVARRAMRTVNKQN